MAFLKPKYLLICILSGLLEDPLEGIRTKLVSDENLFEWDVALFGPPDTLYQGGYFKVGTRHHPMGITSNVLDNCNVFTFSCPSLHLKIICLWKLRPIPGLIMTFTI